MTVRRLTDILLAVLLLLICLPVFAFAGAAVWLEQASAPFLRETRVTRDGRRVQVFRLRTTRQTQFGSRSTPVGALLQRLYLDEIPQLFNVLNGDLSFVSRHHGLVGGIGRKKVLAARGP